MTRTIHVVDLSHWNPEPDWAKLKASGVVGVILKATEGTKYVDPTFAARRVNAQRAGLVVCHYHFLKPGSVDVQMDHYLETVKPWPGERMIIDYEDNGCRLGDLKTAVAILRTSGHPVTVYSGPLIKEQLQDRRDAYLAEETTLWIAHYTKNDEPRWPKATWPMWSLWQYSDGNAGGSPNDPAGCKGDTDCNEYNGNALACQLWLAAKPLLPSGPVKPADDLAAVWQRIRNSDAQDDVIAALIDLDNRLKGT